MEVTPETVKKWLAAHPDRDRHWLADKCDTEKGTVDNWLSSSRGIPSKARIIIEGLMKEDAEIERAKNPAPPMTLVLEVEPERFDAYNHAATAHGQIIREWAVSVLNKAAERDSKRGHEAAPNKITPISKREQIAQADPVGPFPEIPLLRAAAGIPILADAEMVEPDRKVGDGRFLLELRGDSMEPFFHDRQRVILRDKTTLKRPLLKYGDFYCFVHEGAATFKQWAKDSQGNKVLRSLNPEHQDIPVAEDTDWIGWYDPKDNE